MAQLPPQALMQRAGAAIASRAAQLFTEHGDDAPVLVLAGPGNNGGDALEAAAVLADRQIPAQVLLLAKPEQLPEDARASLSRARARGVGCRASLPVTACSLVIDGLFGIGLARPLAAPFVEVIDAVNQMTCPVLAIDVPSGLDADTGMLVGGIAIRASHTLTFIGSKPGLYTGHGRDYAGSVSVDPLGIAPQLFPPPVAVLNGKTLFSSRPGQRQHASHKGSYGDLTVIGGAPGMVGAVILASRMGAMAGAGRVFAACIGPTPAFDPMHPELMCRDARALALDRGAVVAGPGLGRSREASDILARALSCPLPLVLDADALNLVAAEPGLQQRLLQRRAPALLTPHPLEAARLLGSQADRVQADRLQSAAELARRFGAVTILKGSGSVIAAPDGRLVVNGNGNPALATAGSGDVLAGLCGALLAQQFSVWEAALAAVWLHGAAADTIVAAGIGPAGVTAGELVPYIRQGLNAL